MIRRLLIANRGEIACRVAATAHAMGIGTIAVYSDADADAQHVRVCDTAVRIGPPAVADSYLNIDAILAAARATGADAIHPGYGFLSENAAFARACAEASLIFCGPSPEAIETMGDKISAKAAVASRAVPTVPGISRPGLTDAELIAAATDVGFPVLIKPSAGGGGKGMRRVDDATDMPAALASARREAASAFGDDTLFLERFVDTPRHIEVQVLADAHGHVIHLGERECSLQRRHQKVIEEAPSPLLDVAARERIGAAACDAARAVDYHGAGTVEFIVSASAPEEFFFMEMNTRLQVEHRVTELITGLDLVAWQLRIAAGEALTVSQDDVCFDGHAIEARVYAEDPGAGFLPSGGRVVGLVTPDQALVDSGLRTGVVVGSDYDPMLAKVVAHSTDRAAALGKLDAALANTAVLGVRTNIDFCRYLLALPEVVAGDLDTGLLERSLDGYAASAAPIGALIAVAMARTEARWAQVSGGQRSPWDVPNGWRLTGRADVWTRLDAGPATPAVTVGLRGTPHDAQVTITDATIGSLDDAEYRTCHARVRRDRDVLVLTVDGRQDRWLIRQDATSDSCWVAGDGGCWNLRLLPLIDSRIHDSATDDGTIASPMPGTVLTAHVVAGDEVAAGAAVVTVEAMKMEHTLTAPISGVVDLQVAVGDQVTAGQILANVTPESPNQPTG